MAKEAVLTIPLATVLRDTFVAEAVEVDRSPAEVPGELMQEFIERQRAGREHDAFVRGEVEMGHRSARSGVSR